MRMGFTNALFVYCLMCILFGAYFTIITGAILIGMFLYQCQKEGEEDE